MISQTAEYALRAIVCLATDSGKFMTNQDLAATCSIPVGYLAKIMHLLSRRGLVQSQRGKKGGFALAKAANEISMYDIIQAVDPIRRVTTCPLGRPDPCLELCELHSRLDRSFAALEESFRATSMAELAQATKAGFPRGSMP